MSERYALHIRRTETARRAIRWKRRGYLRRGLRMEAAWWKPLRFLTIV